MGLRISNLSTLRFENTDRRNWTYPLVERKTKKKRIIKFNAVSKKAIKELEKYYEELKYSTKEGYLFKSLSPYQKKLRLDEPFTINGVKKLKDISIFLIH